MQSACKLLSTCGEGATAMVQSAVEFKSDAVIGGRDGRKAGRNVTVFPIQLISCRNLCGVSFHGNNQVIRLTSRESTIQHFFSHTCTICNSQGLHDLHIPLTRSRLCNNEFCLSLWQQIFVRFATASDGLTMAKAHLSGPAEVHAVPTQGTVVQLRHVVCLLVSSVRSPDDPCIIENHPVTA